MLRTVLLIAAILLSASASAETVAIVGATLVDLRQSGKSTADVSNSVVVIKDGVIQAAGPSQAVAIPRKAARIDARGKWLIPGLIDGFSAQLDQGFAFANLAMGVTTISQVMADDPRRGRYQSFQLQPLLKPLGSIEGYDASGVPNVTGYSVLRKLGRRLDETGIRAEVATEAAKGATGVMLMYPLDDEQLRWAVDEARRRSLFTIGELGNASYIQAAQAGVQTFIHATRYVLELTPPDLHQAMADAPFNAPAAIQLRYNDFLSSHDSSSPEFLAYARSLAARKVALMPTLAISSTHSPFVPNPWKSQVGPLINAAQIKHLPFDQKTGAASVPAGADPDAYRKRRGEQALKLIDDTGAFHRAGVTLLTGSGAIAFGVLPGWGEHVELALLVRAGLKPREALAAATENFAATYGWRDVGRIAPGYRADLVLLDADPTKDIAAAQSIAAVYLGGRQVDRRALLAWRPH